MKIDGSEGADTTGLLAVDVDIAADGWRGVLDDPQHVCRRAISAAFGRLDYPERTYEVSVVLTDDTRQRKLNAAYRGKDASTNVLSFPAGEDPDGAFPEDLAVPLGDLTLALETVGREAGDEGLSFADHFCHLLVHGMLHLAGYDHETDNDAERMGMLEIEILAGLGVGNPYADKATVLHE